MSHSIARLVRSVDASAEPVSLAEAKRYLNLEGDYEDLFVNLCIKAARRLCEQMADLTFIETEWTYTVDFPPDTWIPSRATCRPRWVDGPIKLPRPPLIEVTSVGWRNASGVLTPSDITPGSGVVIRTGKPGILSFDGYYSSAWYGVASSSFEVVYTAGYGATADDVPPELKIAVLMAVAHYYENRSVDVKLPDAIGRMLDVEAVPGYG